jgi:hypothetical protein
VGHKKVGISMTLKKDALDGVMPGAWCDHRYPVTVHVYDGDRGTRYLRCLAAGLVRKDADCRPAGLARRARRAVSLHLHPPPYKGAKQGQKASTKYFLEARCKGRLRVGHTNPP